MSVGIGPDYTVTPIRVAIRVIIIRGSESDLLLESCVITLAGASPGPFAHGAAPLSPIQRTRFDSAGQATLV